MWTNDDKSKLYCYEFYLYYSQQTPFEIFAFSSKTLVLVNNIRSFRGIVTLILCWATGCISDAILHESYGKLNSSRIIKNQHCCHYYYWKWLSMFRTNTISSLSCIKTITKTLETLIMQIYTRFLLSSKWCMKAHIIDELSR